MEATGKVEFFMIKVHIGLKGSGKTPKMIEAVNAAINIEKGNVVCITEGNRLIHDIDRKARLVDTENFSVKNLDVFAGMLYGIIAQDYDITHIFIDSIFKSVPSANVAELEDFITVLEGLEKKFNVSFTMMVSAEESTAGENVKKYIA